MLAPLLLSALLWTPARAAEPQPFEGAWFRVWENCGEPLAKVPDFSASGGDSNVGRRMVLTLREGQFSAVAMKSLRCGNKGAPAPHPNDSFTVDCDERTENDGTYVVNGDSLHLFATHEEGLNNWGTTFPDWRYVMRGEALELSTTGAANCPLGTFYIYFVRVPDS